MTTVKRKRRAVIYARFSSELQSRASIADQVRLCRRLAEDNGWQIVELFADEAMSGTSHLRPDFQRMQQAAIDGEFDIIIAEALDRLSRDQEHIAALHKNMRFLDIDIVTKSEGEINEMHIGLGGTMNALFLKNLAQKTHRGLEGRVEAGKSGGGRSYGYDLDRNPLPDGTLTKGDLVINTDEARIVNRIFEGYDSGMSARAIAIALNADGVPAPRSGKNVNTWSFSTISGNWRRGTGILNNELYVGQRVWNRQRYIKDPATGRRQARLNNEDQWIRNEVPDLRIIDNGLWTRVKRRQHCIRQQVTAAPSGKSSAGHALASVRRHKHLFSGLLKCGWCNGSYTLMNKSKYGCASARNKGTCDNRKLIEREEVEARILSGLKGQLLRPELLAEFVSEYQREWNRLQNAVKSDRVALKGELKAIRSSIAKIVQAISEGMLHKSMKSKLDELEAREVEMVAKLVSLADEEPILLHPSLAKVYEAKIHDLADSLNDETAKPHAVELLRGLLVEVRLHPNEMASDGHDIELYGELASILALAGSRNDEPHRFTGGVSVTLVAGVGFEPTTFRL